MAQSPEQQKQYHVTKSFKALNTKSNRTAIDFTPMIHPAARGRIRRKDRYMEHVRDVLTQVL